MFVGEGRNHLQVFVIVDAPCDENFVAFRELFYYLVFPRRGGDYGHIVKERVAVDGHIVDAY